MVKLLLTLIAVCFYLAAPAWAQAPRRVALGDWPESLERLPCEVVDHGEVFGLEAIGGFGSAGRVVDELTDGGVVAGELVAAAGPDLYVAVGVSGQGVVIDSRLMSGWRLGGLDGMGEAGGAGDGEWSGVTVPVRGMPVVQGGLF